MTYIDQNSSELRLSLTDSSFDKEVLSVILEKDIEVNGFTINYGILGASHFVSLKKNNVDFTEVFACVSLEKTESIKLNKQIVLHKEMEKASYSMKAEIIPFKEDKELVNHMKALLRSYEGLYFDFPLEKEGNFEACTIVVLYPVQDGIKIETIHAYPNEDNVVKTTSFFKAF